MASASEAPPRTRSSRPVSQSASAGTALVDPGDLERAIDGQSGLEQHRHLLRHAAKIAPLAQPSPERRPADAIPRSAGFGADRDVPLPLQARHHLFPRRGFHFAGDEIAGCRNRLVAEARHSKYPV